ncbi:MAG: glycosyltransferase family 4 protein [Desulfovibrio sp.]|jgi:hypothetical protein|nr:glycosyltransferase family 4 protein [Desulfovibrio sp.]
MIRVAWPAFTETNWTGGLNYFLNLARALQSVSSPRVNIVLLGNETRPVPPLDNYPSISLPCLNKYGFYRFLDKVLRRATEGGGLLAASLAEKNINLLSHGRPLGEKSPVPALCWIPDFQELYLPEFFTKRELRSRRGSHARTAAQAQGVVLSSRDAWKKFCGLFPEAAGKAYILNFVAYVPPEESLPPATEVMRIYGIGEPYFHVPNQLWAHKNHRRILEALCVLQERGKCPLVISTGQTRDYRALEFFNGLQKAVTSKGLAERFRFLGLVPFSHVAVLMRNSVALVNPSLFEGWSTTVEEAKSLGKKILLSDLAVHREQAPARAEYFAPDDASTLALLMQKTIEEFDPVVERTCMEEATRSLPQRMAAYGRAYEDIVIDVLARLPRG